MKRLLTILCIPALLLFGGPSEGYAFDRTDLKKLLAMNSCVSCDLSNAKLNWEYLKGANLKGANLKGANLYNTTLDDADLSGADLRYADLRKASLIRTNLTDANLSGVSLGEAWFQSAILCRTTVPWGVENRDCSTWDKMKDKILR